MTTTTRYALLAELPFQARTVARVAGDDAQRFLQGLLTADVSEPVVGRAIPAALLTVKGKIVSEVWVLATDEDTSWLVLPAEIGEAVVTKLDDHIIMDDVELELISDHGCAIVWRDQADGAPLGAGQLGALPEGVRAFEATHPLPGVLLVGPAEGLADLSELGEPADHELFTAARVRHARPAWGFELAPERFPPEVGFVDAVSYDKGCYLGQEPLSRIHNRGAVKHVMVRVRLCSRGSVTVPITLNADDSEREAGQLTSLGAGNLGLAIVTRAHAKPGTALRAGSAKVEVLSAPLGDDPGRSDGSRPATATLGGRR